ncbi:S-adenosyl-l-methionine hydroxide adenosyltransferase family protein [Saliphagus sp. LR7]|uniref:SAM hydrolase/SAM-dependent halogenase family protein n=1 Tax=Saliphagus sp. LR7 TaxID=2282654 RepID=UPI000DF79353|nr:SAM-dependent chlorinase/fluorinase [Saliphagus sp. LR7]
MITLASDFGSPYPAAMKGVLLAETDPQPRLVDVAHDFPRGDVRTAAFWLREVLPYFPPAAHLAVVDPGVGTDRAALAVRAGDHALVGPDNGLLLPAARRLGEVEPFVVDESISGRVGHPSGGSASTTFHGRDVFAPAAAAVHEAGIEEMETLSALEPADDVTDCRFPEATLEDGRATGEVLVVDGFGNVVTNVPGSALAGVERVEAAGKRVPAVETFAAVPESEGLATVGSHGYVELDVNDGRGETFFGLSAGDDVALEFDPD